MELVLPGGEEESQTWLHATIYLYDSKAVVPSLIK